jgi:outer membrane protein assembly factor BamB
VSVLRRRSRVVPGLGLCAALGLATLSPAADWPQFLGQDSNGIAPDAKGLLRQWPAEGLKAVWTTPVGMGYAGPAIFGDNVLILDREGQDNDGKDAKDVLRRINLKDGKEIWRSEYDAPGKLDHPASRSTPATDGKLVFSIGPFGQIRAVTFADGKVVWKGDMLKDWEVARPGWGVSTSPLLYGDWVIMAPWGKKAALVAYEKATGNVAWTTPNPKGIVQDYQSPVPMKLGGRSMIVSNSRQGYMIGVDARDGRQLWEYTGYAASKKGWNIPSPIQVPDDRVLIIGGYGAGSAMIKIEAQGDQFAVKELWKNVNMGSMCNQALVYDGFIYCNSADVEKGLICLTLDGQVKWDSKAQRKFFDMGAILIADGLIFALHGQSGDLYMVEASPEGYRELGKVSLLSRGENWAPMAFANGKLIIRDHAKQMVCLDLMAK